MEIIKQRNMKSTNVMSPETFYIVILGDRKDNHALLDESGNLKKNLIKNQDYSIVCSEIWKNIKDQYSCEIKAEGVYSLCILFSCHGLSFKNIYVHESEKVFEVIQTLFVNKMFSYDVFRQMFEVKCNNIVIDPTTSFKFFEDEKKIVLVVSRTNEFMKDENNNVLESILVENGFASREEDINELNNLDVLKESDDIIAKKAMYNKIYTVNNKFYSNFADSQPNLFRPTTLIKENIQEFQSCPKDDMFLNSLDKSNNEVSGIINIGNTCYMNSGIQCLNNCKIFSDFFILYNRNFKDKSQKPFFEIKKNRFYDQNINIIEEWSNLTVLLNSKISITPHGLKNALGARNSMYIHNHEQDAAEFINAILSFLHEGLCYNMNEIISCKDTSKCKSNHDLMDSANSKVFKGLLNGNIIDSDKNTNMNDLINPTNSEESKVFKGLLNGNDRDLDKNTNMNDLVDHTNSETFKGLLNGNNRDSDKNNNINDLMNSTNREENKVFEGLLNGNYRDSDKNSNINDLLEPTNSKTFEDATTVNNKDLSNYADLLKNKENSKSKYNLMIDKKDNINNPNEIVNIKRTLLNEGVNEIYNNANNQREILDKESIKDKLFKSTNENKIETSTDKKKFSDINNNLIVCIPAEDELNKTDKKTELNTRIEKSLTSKELEQDFEDLIRIEKSIVSDLFYGMHTSFMKCNNCSFEKHKSDLTMSLTLPIPNSIKYHSSTIFLRLRGIPVKILANLDYTIEELINEITTNYSLDSSFDLLAVEYLNGDAVRIIRDHTYIKNVSGKIYLYEYKTHKKYYLCKIYYHKYLFFKKKLPFDFLISGSNIKSKIYCKIRHFLDKNITETDFNANISVPKNIGDSDSVFGLPILEVGLKNYDMLFGSNNNYFDKFLLSSRNDLTLMDCLNYYSKPENVELFCENCKTNSNYEVKSRMTKFPKYLIIHLKRFSFVKDNSKINTFIDFPLDRMIIEGNSYRLVGTCNHLEIGLGYGHYVSYIIRNSEWYCCNDSVISKVNSPDKSTAYILFYEMED